jgi:hypothetical protein
MAIHLRLLLQLLHPSALLRRLLHRQFFRNLFCLVFTILQNNYSQECVKINENKIKKYKKCKATVILRRCGGGAVIKLKQMRRRRRLGYTRRFCVAVGGFK